MTRTTHRLVHLASGLALILAAACERDSQRDDIPASDALADPEAALIARFTAGLPPDLLVRRRACPFECCTYRDWTATAETAVLAKERGRGTPIFIIPPGQTFRADSGNVHVTSVALVAATDSVADLPYWSVAAGDTLVILDYIGEGYYNVWDGTKLQQLEGFWDTGRVPRSGVVIGEHRTEWWVHVTMPDGRTGWVRADTAPRFDNADACGQ